MRWNFSAFCRLPVFLLLLLHIVSCEEGGPDKAEVWPKKGLIMSSYGDVGTPLDEYDTIYIGVSNSIGMKKYGPPEDEDDGSTIWTLSPVGNGTITIRNEDGKYLGIDDTFHPVLGIQNYLMVSNNFGDPSAPPCEHCYFRYHKTEGGFYLEAATLEDWFLYTDGHALGGNGLTFHKTSNKTGGLFWLFSK
jgi:hypothetical protein